MTQAPTAPAHAAAAPNGGAAGGPPSGGPPMAAVLDRYLNSTTTGLEGREAEVGAAIQYVIRTLRDQIPYSHEMNDALIKLHLQVVQFAKDTGVLEEYVAHDVKTMAPVNKRMGTIIEKTGNKEIAVIAVAEYSTCHFQMILDAPRRSHDGLRRTWVSPFKTVLDAGSPIKQFDTTEQWLHEHYTIPRMDGYAKDLGVEFEYSTWDESTREVWVQVKP